MGLLAVSQLKFEEGTRNEYCSGNDIALERGLIKHNPRFRFDQANVIGLNYLNVTTSKKEKQVKLFHRLALNVSYQNLVTEEERKLRWMIKRHCKVIEFRYYLLFLLLAHGEHQKLLQECRRILEIYPTNCLARALLTALTKEKQSDPWKKSPTPSKERVALRNWAFSHTKRQEGCPKYL